KFELDRRVWPLLERARSLYDEAFNLDAAAYWAVVQYISLSVVMWHGDRLMQANEEIGNLWALAEVQSLRELSRYERRAWALSNLIELYLLAPAIKDLQARARPGPPPDWRALATHHAKELAKMARPGAFEIFSTRRVMVQYLDLYAELCPSGTLEGA